MRLALSLTEKGEGQVTVSLLLQVIASAIYDALRSDDFCSPTCSYLCATLNLMGHQGLVELAGERKKGGPATPVDTSQAPSFITEAFGRAEGKGDAKAD